MNWFVGGFGTTGVLRRAGLVLEKEFMVPDKCLPANLRLSGRETPVSHFFLPAAGPFTSYPIWDFAWGFSGPKRAILYPPPLSPIGLRRTPIGLHRTPSDSHRNPIGLHRTPTDSHRSPIRLNRTPTDSHRNPIRLRRIPTTSVGLNMF